MPMHFFDQITLVLAILSSFFLVLIALQPEKELKPLTLLLTFFTFAIFSWSQYFVALKSRLIIYTAFVMMPAAVTIGPNLYFYMHGVTTGKKMPRWSFGLFYLVLPLAALLVQVFVFMTQPDWHNLQHHLNLTGFTGDYLNVFMAVINVLNLGFMGITCRDLYIYHINADEKVYHTDIGWLYLFLSGFIVIYVVFAMAIILSIVVGKNLIVNPVLSLIAIFHLFLMIYYLVKKPRVVSLPEKPYVKYAKQALGEETSQKYLAELKKLMHEKKPFLDDRITLAQLAYELKVPAHHLSMVINSKMKMNFYQLINHFRVEEAKNLLAEGDSNLSVLRIGYESGFQSKTTFNSIFKKLTGKTPTQFRQWAQEAAARRAS